VHGLGRHQPNESLPHGPTKSTQHASVTADVHVQGRAEPQPHPRSESQALAHPPDHSMPLVPGRRVTKPRRLQPSRKSWSSSLVHRSDLETPHTNPGQSSGTNTHQPVATVSTSPVLVHTHTPAAACEPSRKKPENARAASTSLNLSDRQVANHSRSDQDRLHDGAARKEVRGTTRSSVPDRHVSGRAQSPREQRRPEVPDAHAPGGTGKTPHPPPKRHEWIQWHQIQQLQDRFVQFGPQTGPVQRSSSELDVMSTPFSRGQKSPNIKTLNDRRANKSSSGRPVVPIAPFAERLECLGLNLPDSRTISSRLQAGVRHEHGGRLRESEQDGNYPGAAVAHSGAKQLTRPFTSTGDSLGTQDRGQQGTGIHDAQNSDRSGERCARRSDRKGISDGPVTIGPERSHGGASRCADTAIDKTRSTRGGRRPFLAATERSRGTSASATAAAPSLRPSTESSGARRRRRHHTKPSPSRHMVRNLICPAPLYQRAKTPSLQNSSTTQRRESQSLWGPRTEVLGANQAHARVARTADTRQERMRRGRATFDACDVDTANSEFKRSSGREFPMRHSIGGERIGCSEGAGYMSDGSSSSDSVRLEPWTAMGDCEIESFRCASGNVDSTVPLHSSGSVDAEPPLSPTDKTRMELELDLEIQRIVATLEQSTRQSALHRKRAHTDEPHKTPLQHVVAGR